MAMQLKISHIKKGPTLRLALALGYRNNQDQRAISETFKIDGLAELRVKVFSKSHSAVYETTLGVKKHETMKDSELRMTVNSAQLQYSETWPCAGIWTWASLGTMKGTEIIPYDHTSICFSGLDIEISVHVCKPPFSFKLYENSDMTDFYLSTSEGIVAMHKLVLAVHSDVFKTMFTEWKETKENLIQIKNFSLQTVQHLKEFLYLGTLPDDGLRPLLALAELYSINDLKREGSWKLAKISTPKDFYSLHKFACENNIPELSYALAEFTMADVIQKARKIQISEDEVKKLTENK